MKIRQAVPSDAEAIGNLRVKAWQAAYSAFMPSHYLATLDSSANLDALRQRLEHPADNFILAVAETENMVVAFSILGTPRYESVSGCIELWALNVLPEFWRRGIGRSLTTNAITTASALKASRVELWCIKGNAPAQAVYESCGFTETGQERMTSSLTGHPLREALYAKTL